MAADSDGSGESLTTVVTCEGDLQDPEFPAKFELLLDKLHLLLCGDGQADSDKLRVHKLEPWNSVRVTLAIPRDAALRLRQLASEGSQQLRALGILSVQLEGDQVISLRLATSFGQEPQEIVLRTASDVNNVNSSNGGVASSLSRILASTATSSVQNAPSTSATVAAESPVDNSDKVQFRSPNVVCPTDTQVPKVPASIVQSSASTSGTVQRNYNGPFPFASMTHAAQAIHSREHAFTQPPPPYPSQPTTLPPPATVKSPAINPNSPNVAMSSPLLVNLLQNDGGQVQNKILPSTVTVAVDQRKPLVVSKENTLETVSNNTNSAFVPAAVPSPVPSQPAIKYAQQTITSVNANATIFSATQNNSSVPTATSAPTSTPAPISNSNLLPPQPQANSLILNNPATQALGVRSVGPVGPRLSQQFVQQKVNTPVSVRPLVQQACNTAIRSVRPPPPTMSVTNQKFTPTAQFGPQFPRQNFRGPLGQQFTQQSTPQVQQSQQQPQSFQQNFQQFPNPPPYPRQRLEAVRPGYQDITRFQQQRIQQSGWQQQHQHTHPFSQMDSNVTPVGQPMPSLSGLSQINNQALQPIAQPMPHLGSLNSVLDNSLSNITPSLTDLSKTDLDSLLPSLDDELDSASDLPDIPEALTSNGKKRQYLINPLTGVLEPMPSDSSDSDSEHEADGKETTDIFNDFHSPLNDRSNSIYSDDDTCSTTISRKFDTTDQSDSEATVKSTNSENSVKSHQRIKSGKNRDRDRDRNRDSPSLKKNKDLPTEKIKLRLKLEKSEPVSPAYKVDISFINTQQPKRATQNVARPTMPQSPNVPCPTVTPAGEELRVPPLHISLRGRNSVVINSEKKKKYSKLNPDGTTIEMKKSKKNIDGLKLKKSFNTKELAMKSSSLLSSSASSTTTITTAVTLTGITTLTTTPTTTVASTTLLKNESTLIGQKNVSLTTIASELTTLPSTSTLEQKHSAEVKMTSDILKSDGKLVKSLRTSDVDDLPLKHRMREPGEVLSTTKPLKPISGDLKKSKKTNKFNHIDLYREQNLLTGGHLVDDYKVHKKLKSDEKFAHKSFEHSNKLNSHFKKDKFKEKVIKERMLPGHVGEVRRGSDSEVVKCLKRHADSNGLSHTEKKRRLSQSENKIHNLSSTLTESQGVNKSVKLKSTSSCSEGHLSALSSEQAVVGSTNVGTISSVAGKSLSKASIGNKTQKTLNNKLKRERVMPFVKTKEGNCKTKDLNRDKTYSQNVAEKLAKQLPTIGEIDMEAKFKQSLLESSTDIPRRHTQTERKLDPQKLHHNADMDRVAELAVVQKTLSPRNDTNHQISPTELQKSIETTDVDITSEITTTKSSKEQTSPDRKSTDADLAQTQRLDDKQAGRSPNSGGQGEDSGIESMDALSEKSPNQASQSPHSHTDITLTDIKKTDPKLENCITDIMDIEEQLAKMDGLPTLNGDLSHMIKTEPFMKTETLIEKLEGIEGKDLNENKEHVKEVILGECCGGSVTDLKVQTSIEMTSNKCISNDDFKDNALQKAVEDECTNKSTITLTATVDSSIKEELPSKGGEKDLDFDPLPIRRKPPLYTYSNPEKQSRDADSPLPNLSDLESENSDSNSEYTEIKPKINPKTGNSVTRRRKQNLDNISMNENELDGCIEAIDLTELTGFKKNDIVKKTPKSLLEQLLIEIPSEISDKQISSTSPSVSEKSLNTSKSSIRTRSSSKLSSPDISDAAKIDKNLKTPRHSPVILKQDSPANSPVLCSSKASPKSSKTNLTGGNVSGTLQPAVKRKRQESESSTQSNVSLDDTSVTISRTKKSRKCSENAVELIKACMGVEHPAESTLQTANNSKSITQKGVHVKETRKLAAENKSKLSSGLLRKSQLIDLESSDSDEPLIEIAGKVRNKHHVATRNKLNNSTKSNLITSVKSVPVVSSGSSNSSSSSNSNNSSNSNSNNNNGGGGNGGGGGGIIEEKSVNTRRSVRNNAGTAMGPVSLKTRSKLQSITEKTVVGTGGAIAINTTISDADANRRKTRSAVCDDGKRRRNSRDGK